MSIAFAVSEPANFKVVAFTVPVVNASCVNVLVFVPLLTVNVPSAKLVFVPTFNVPPTFAPVSIVNPSDVFVNLVELFVTAPSDIKMPFTLLNSFTPVHAVVVSPAMLSADFNDVTLPAMF